MNKLFSYIYQKLCIEIFNAHPIPVTKVFTPTSAAIVNYVERVDLEEKLNSDLNTPGKQIVLYGSSGSGKTTIIQHLLSKKGLRYIITHCDSQITFESIILNAFDNLNVFIKQETTKKSSSSKQISVDAEYQSLKSLCQLQQGETVSTRYAPLLPPQLTPQKLAKFCGELNTIWIIEDFHKVKAEEKKRIADTLKIFVDVANQYNTTKVICIGASETASELVQFDPNLKHRVSEVRVPLLSENYIRSIIRNGFEMLNVRISPSLEDKLYFYSARLGSQVHQMCLDICNGSYIKQRNRRCVTLDDTAFTEYAVKGFLEHNEGKFSLIYDKAIRSELGWYVLVTFTNNSQEKLALREIKKLVNQEGRSFSDEDIMATLDELQSPENEIIIYNQSTEKYRISSPFWLAFLRLQFAIEQKKKDEASHNQRNNNLRLVDSSSRYADVERVMLDLLDKLRQMRAF